MWLIQPAKCVADRSSLLLGTYPVVRKGPRPEVGTSLTILATGSGGMGYSGHKVRNSAPVYRLDDFRCQEM